MSAAHGKAGRRRLLLGLANLTLALLLVLAVQRAGRAAAAVAQGPREEMVGQLRNRPLEGLTAREVGAPSSQRVDLGGLRDAMVMVFDTACGPCAVNMGNWADLAHEARSQGVALVALTVEPAAGAAAYWSGWEGVRVLAADTVTMRDELKVLSTPTTLLVQEGVVRRVYPGPLGAPARQELLRWIGNR